MTTLHPFVEFLIQSGVIEAPPERRLTGNGHPPGPAPVPGDPRMSQYVATALVTECDDIARTPEGSRNQRLNVGAFRMGQLVGPGWLDLHEADDCLTAAGLASGLEPGEVAATVRSGLNAGIGAPREVDLGPAAGQIEPAWTVDEGLVGAVPDSSGQVPDSPGDDGDGLPRLVDWHEAWDSVNTEPDWLVPDVLERGRSHVLYAPHKVGKSLVTQAWCAQLAGQGVRVLYVDLENSLADVVERLQDMGCEPGELATLGYLSFPSMAALDTMAGGVTLRALVAKHASELVVLDTTARVVTGAENDSDTFRALYRHALVPLKAAGVTVLRLDHAGKDPAAGQRGSSGKGDDVDTIWFLSVHDQTRFVLKCDAQRSGHHPLTVELVKRFDPLRFERVDDPFSRPETTVCIDRLDRLQVPDDAGREVARAALTAAGFRVQNSTLAEAIRARKVRLTSWDDLSRTGRTGVDLVKINKSCPQDQLAFSISADETCPGQVADSADSEAGVPKAVPVRSPVRLKSGQERTDGQDRSGTAPPAPAAEDQQFDPAEDQQNVCQKCHRETDEIRVAVWGRWRRLCIECAYPDPSNRPGSVHDEEENL